MGRDRRLGGAPVSLGALLGLLLVSLVAVVPGGAATAAGLEYSSLFGGSGDEVALGTAVDAQGNLYVSGSTESANLPTTAGAPQGSYDGGGDAFVAKFGPDGKLLFSTYLGGSGADAGRSIAVDAAGNVYVTGWTESADFPTLHTAASTLGGPRDGFLAKLSPSGAVDFSTLIGGSGVDSALVLAIDSTGSVYLSGETTSPDFPTSPGAYDRQANGDVDAFVTKVTPSGTIAYSTYLGSPGFDDGLAIVVDANGQALVTGKASTGFPVTQGAYDTQQNGGYDMFVTKLGADGAALVYSTYLGGSGWDEGLGIDVDADGNAYVTGNVQSPNFPTTGNAYQRTLSGAVNACVTKIDPTGSALVYSTLLGGSSWTEGDALSVDAAGNAVVAGHLGSPDYPTTAGALDTTYNGSVDGFLTRVDQSGSTLVYSTYLGGSGWDGAMTFTLAGDAYLSGASTSSDFPVTPASPQSAPAGGMDVFATRLAPTASQSPPDFGIAAVPGVVDIVRGQTATYTVTITKLNGWQTPVELDVAGLPAGAVAVFAPDPAGDSATMTVTSSPATAPGAYPLTISGSAGDRTRSATVRLDVHNCCA